MSIHSAIDALIPVLGDAITTSKSDCDLHGRSESHFAVMRPDAVVYPHDTQQVSDIVKICHEHGCPVIGFGVGTSLEA
ncbi:MAG: FAD-binding protein, partial [Pseudomonadota bacterium]